MTLGGMLQISSFFNCDKMYNIKNCNFSAIKKAQFRAVKDIHLFLQP